MYLFIVSEWRRGLGIIGVFVHVFGILNMYSLLGGFLNGVVISRRTRQSNTSTYDMEYYRWSVGMMVYIYIIRRMGKGELVGVYLGIDSILHLHPSKIFNCTMS